MYGQHDCQWIDEGLPGAGNLLIFNNGTGRPGGNYSSADEVIPPINSIGTYDLAVSLPYGPAAATWSGNHPNPTSFFSSTTSGCQRQPNGNTLLVEGDRGFFIEINSGGALVWSWQSPFPTQGQKRTFKGQRHPGGLVGVTYCDPAVTNSSGSPASIKALGSANPSDNAVTLWAENLPTGEFGFFLNGTGNGVTPMAGGSLGNLCVSGSIGRYNGPGQIFSAGALGRGALELDLTQTPTPQGLVTVLAGQTWNFQCWFRDTPASSSNFTNAVQVLFQ